MRYVLTARWDAQAATPLCAPRTTIEPVGGSGRDLRLCGLTVYDRARDQTCRIALGSESATAPEPGPWPGHPEMQF